MAQMLFFYECNLMNLRLALRYFSKQEELDLTDGVNGLHSGALGGVPEVYGSSDDLEERGRNARTKV